MPKTKKKKANRGKSKGSQFERVVSGLIDTWWEVPKKTFWRTVQSGGWEQPGDIAPRIPPGGQPIWFPFVVECKFYRTIDLWHLLKPKNKRIKIIDWWEQVTEEQKTVKDKSNNFFARLLVFKQNNTPVFVAFNKDDVSLLLKRLIFYDPVRRISVGFNSKFGEQSIDIIPWNDFVRIYVKESFLERQKNV